MIGNRFELVLIASLRQRELARKYRAKVMTEHGPHLTSLKEIEDGLITRDYLKRVK